MTEKEINLQMLKLCIEIGDMFGQYFEKDKKHYLNNGETIFEYQSKKELLTDWVDSLVEQQLAGYDPAAPNDTSCYWESEILFIYQHVIGKYPKYIRRIDGKKGTTFSVQAYKNDGSRHGQNIYLGSYNSIVDAIKAVKEYENEVITV